MGVSDGVIEAKLVTKWSSAASVSTPHPEYPRPQLVRADWLNLNGLWDFASLPSAAPRPVHFPELILVPFPAESALSGIGCRVDPETRLWYRRRFRLPATWRAGRTLLHFGAVDWECVVSLNGREIGSHRGGYDGFSLDVTEELVDGEQELVVSVVDPTDAGTQPRGKQTLNPQGIYYVGSSGIWQTVWLEPVPDAFVRGLKIVSDVAAGVVLVTPDVVGAGTVSLRVTDGDSEVAVAQGIGGQEIAVSVPEAKHWSPDSPHLYGLTAILSDGTGSEIDRVDSYFGMRQISLSRDAAGILRPMLNGRAIFMCGPLDQGFWPDGLYTAPSDDALRYDLEVTKRLGFNTVRKHVKIEPSRWYHWCDRLGLIVWQDMPSGDASIDPEDPDLTRTPESAAQFQQEFRAMVEGLFNHPSIAVWVVFNEGLGQFETVVQTEFARSLDSTRLIDSTTGWSDRGVGDMIDVHVYPGPVSPAPESTRMAALGEFGGIGLPIRGHSWTDESNWGYVSYSSQKELTDAFVSLLERTRPLIESPGLSAAIYTQTTDVETECNGLMTYDREILKVEEGRAARAIRSLIGAI